MTRRATARKPKIRSIAPQARASESTVRLLESLLEEAREGRIISIVTISDKPEGWHLRSSYAYDRARLIGLLTMALHNEVGK